MKRFDGLAFRIGNSADQLRLDPLSLIGESCCVLGELQRCIFAFLAEGGIDHGCLGAAGRFCIHIITRSSTFIRQPALCGYPQSKSLQILVPYLRRLAPILLVQGISDHINHKCVG
ncbi:hypothetical protein D3C81_1898100 [compost metagenome]